VVTRVQDLPGIAVTGTTFSTVSKRYVFETTQKEAHSVVKRVF
jgi:hypothetical protein